MQKYTASQTQGIFMGLRKTGVPAQPPQKPVLGDSLHLDTPPNMPQIYILLGKERKVKNSQEFGAKQ